MKKTTNEFRYFINSKKTILKPSEIEPFLKFKKNFLFKCSLAYDLISTEKGKQNIKKFIYNYYNKILDKDSYYAGTCLGYFYLKYLGKQIIIRKTFTPSTGISNNIGFLLKCFEEFNDEYIYNYALFLLFKKQFYIFSKRQLDEIKQKQKSNYDFFEEISDGVYKTKDSSILIIDDEFYYNFEIPVKVDEILDFDKLESEQKEILVRPEALFFFIFKTEIKTKIKYDFNECLKKFGISIEC